MNCLRLLFLYRVELLQQRLPLAQCLIVVIYLLFYKYVYLKRKLCYYCMLKACIG